MREITHKMQIHHPIRTITTLLLVLLALPLAAQKVTFKGRVTDEAHNPIEIASVSIMGQPVGTLTDLREERHGYHCFFNDGPPDTQAQLQ